MKKSQISLFVYSQIFLLSSPGFMGVAHAANLLSSQSRITSRKQEESNELTNQLAQDLTVIGQNKESAPSILASTYTSQYLNKYMNRYGHASASINFGKKGKVESADINFLKPIIDKKNMILRC